MKTLLVLGSLAALAAGAVFAAPASAHDACDDSYSSRRSGYGSSYYGSGYGSGYYGSNYYGSRSYRRPYYGDSYGRRSSHDYEHDRLNDQHERWHETHPYASRYEHEREHKKLAEKHDVYHHRAYGEHAPNHADWYYGDGRDYRRY